MRLTNWLTLLLACTGTAIGACGSTRDITGHETNPPPGDTTKSGGVDSGGPGARPAVVTGATPVAIVDNSVAVHVFSVFTGRLDGTLRRQLHFSNVADPIVGNDPSLRVTDDKLAGLSSPALSPDGQRLAVVASVAMSQSEIVVIGVDGAAPEVASPNSALVTGGVAWSPDGTKLAYGTTTASDSTHVQLTITNLAAHTVSRIPGVTMSSPTAIQWSPDGKSLVIATHAGTAPNVLSNLLQVDVTTGAMHTVAAEIPGEITSISSTATRVLLTRTANSDSGVTTQLIEHTLAGSERIVISFDAVGGHYVAASDELAVITGRVTIDGHTSVETFVRNLQTGVGLEVGAGASISVDAARADTTPGLHSIFDRRKAHD